MYRIYRPDNRFEILNLTMPQGYGAIYIHDNAVAQTLTNQNEFYLITGTWLEGDCSGFTPDTANNRIICNEAGEYQINCQINYNGANIDGYQFAIFVNGVQNQELTVHTDARQTTQTISTPVMGLVSLAKNDIIDLRAECTTSAGTQITVVHVNIALARAIGV